MKNARTSVLHERLAKAAAYLERLDVERFAHGNPNLGKTIEERIIWRELLDLELQEFDEQMERLSEVAHSLIPNVGKVTHGCAETQHPQRPATPSPWWRMNRFFR
jgi:hypothetical protein